MIEKVLLPEIAYSEILGVVESPDVHAQELGIVARAVPKRVQQFCDGRHCLRQAMRQLGIIDTPVLKGPSGEPLLPDGFAGSITHCDGYCAAAVVQTSLRDGLGIDAEINEGLIDGVLAYVSSPLERELLEPLPAGTHWDRLLFSAKEALYKAWFPITKRELRFTDVTINFEPCGQGFEIAFKDDVLGILPRPPENVIGRYAISTNFILCSVSINRE